MSPDSAVPNEGKSINLLPLPRFIQLSDKHVRPSSLTRRIDANLPSQGYVLQIGQYEVTLSGGDDAGLYYGEVTLRQLYSIYGQSLPAGTIRDYPDIPVRAAMIDISRDKVPKIDTLHELIARLASWKINQLQLYTEHTFAYRNHPLVHQSASPYTADQICDLDAFCARHFVELVPNQNCLGHMSRWLIHDRYRHLAIEPDGFIEQAGFGLRRPPMTLDPSNPGALELVRELLGELLPLFQSRRVHVGLDEAMELPEDRIGDYLKWVTDLRMLPELDGHEMLIWGDMVADKPELLEQLPKSGITVCEWGYETSHPFDERCAGLAAAGVPFWVVPGTSSWLSIVGRVTNAKENCIEAARAALEHGAEGYMITDWGDQGHLQQFPICDPGFAYGAAFSWCLESNQHIDIAAALSAHSYQDPSGELAAALLLLGDASRTVKPQVSNASSVILHLYYPQMTVGQGLTKGLAGDQLGELTQLLCDARARLVSARPERSDSEVLVEEIFWSIDLLELLVADAAARLAGDGSFASIANGTRKQLAAQLAELIERHRRLWLTRNRLGGLNDSISWLQNLRSAYESGQPDPDWAGFRAL